jgi:hypothetical protein
MAPRLGHFSKSLLERYRAQNSRSSRDAVSCLFGVFGLASRARKPVYSFIPIRVALRRRYYLQQTSHVPAILFGRPLSSVWIPNEPHSCVFKLCTSPGIHAPPLLCIKTVGFIQALSGFEQVC